VPEVTCPSCGHDNTVGSRFCSSCGTALADDGDRTTMTFAPTTDAAAPETSETPVPEVEVDLTDVPSGTGVLVVTRGEAAGSRILLDLETTTAGRHPDSGIFLDDITVSRRHAVLEPTTAGWHLRDVGSLNGTYVNGERVDDAVLSNGDELQIGKFKLVYIQREGSAPADAR
jgi:pSer/pThr/pTyr-binding forkhead associated (FHA) protein